MRRVIGAIFIVIFSVGAAFAAEIRPITYSYPYEFAASAIEPTFIVCDNCPPRKFLTPAPRIVPTVIALRVSEPDPPKPEPSNADVEQKERNEQEKIAKDTPLTIFFDLNSATLRQEEKGRLQTVSSLFKAGVTVTGYTCDKGSDEYNRSLSLKRAKAVANYLRQLGVAPLEIIGKGKCCPISDKKELNRRVEIKEVR